MTTLTADAVYNEGLRRSMKIWLALAALAFVLAASHSGAEINFTALAQNFGNIGELLRGFFPPDFTQGPEYARQMLVTIQIALWGSFIAFVVAVPFGFLCASNIAPVTIAQPARRLMDCCRAINEMVFALIFIVAVGLGPFAGVLALAVHTTGVLAKLFSEAVEAIEPGPVEGIRATGASALAVLRFGVLPQVLPLWVSYVLYRFESNVRSATVLGIVGAGGIGQLLYESLRGFYYPQACAAIIVIVLSVVVIDLLSSRIRKILI